MRFAAAVTIVAMTSSVIGAALPHPLEQDGLVVPDKQKYDKRDESLVVPDKQKYDKRDESLVVPDKQKY
ncbi:hypothetical protein, partial [Listeria monocytogenes]